MAEAEHLALAFLADHPQEAALVLEGMPQRDAVELFDQVPSRTAGPVLAAMVASAAARIVAAMSTEAALSVLAAAGTQATVAALRHVPEPRRTELVAGLPTGTAVASRLLLGFPDDTAGALVDPDVIALAPTMRVHDALARLRSAEQPRVDEVHVTAADRSLVGVVDLHTLLRANETSTLGPIARKPVGVVAAAMPLASAATHRGWEYAVVLPVVERGGRFIGVLRRAVLLRALARSRTPARNNGGETVAGTLARGYWDAVSSLAGAALTVLPPVKPVRAEEP
jgi:magnesium transporter